MQKDAVKINIKAKAPGRLSMNAVVPQYATAEKDNMRLDENTGSFRKIESTKPATHKTAVSG